MTAPQQDADTVQRLRAIVHDPQASETAQQLARYQLARLQRP
jgi:hypothetical protein